MKHLKFNTFLLTLLLSMAGITAAAHSITVANEDGKTIYYVWIYDNTKLAVSYQGDYGTHYSNEYSGNVVIPESVTYNGATYPVTSIGSSAFYDCPGLTSVTIPNSVTSIGSGAFDGTAWYNNQPDGLVYAGKVAYKYKGTMPANTSISLQEGTLGIAGSAFNNCSGLTSMTIPSSVTNIDIFAFENCPNLTNIIIDSDNTIYDSRNNCNAIIETISNTLIVGCKNTTIPNSVTSIGDYAFYSCSGLTSLTIPNSVTSIGNSALWCCSGLTSVTIPNSVTSIGISAFWGCSALTSVTIPNSVRTINRETFYNCSNLTTVKIGNSVTSIGPFAFYNCSSLTSLNIPDSVTSIGDQAFSGTALFDNISDGVFYIGKWVFGYKGTLPTNLSLEEGTIGIIPYAFDGYDNQLSVTLPNSMSAIGDHSFTRCSGLESITIPSSITSIGVGAFSYCTSLTSVDFPNTINSIGASAFIGCASLTSVTLPSSVTSIEASTFLGCANLTSVTIPNSVTNVGFRAFLDCI